MPGGGGRTCKSSTWNNGIASTTANAAVCKSAEASFDQPARLPECGADSSKLSANMLPSIPLWDEDIDTARRCAARLKWKIKRPLVTSGLENSGTKFPISVSCSALPAWAQQDSLSQGDEEQFRWH